MLLRSLVFLTFNLYSQKSQQKLFDQLETGHVSSEEFIMRIANALCRYQMNILLQLNAMLKDVKKNKLDYIISLKKVITEPFY